MSTRVVVVNQHGDNRGDEAALRGLVHALQARIQDLHITVLHQFRYPESKIELTDVDYLPLRIRLHEAALLSMWSIPASFGIHLDFILRGQARKIVSAYKSSHLVISAPGGPYFGDLYANHELVHWFYLWLGRILKKPLVQYQPSAGPFKNRLLNVVRRRGYRWFSLLTVREPISASHISELTGLVPVVGCDSAFHDEIAPADRSELADLVPEAESYVAATFRRPDESKQAKHDQAVIDALLRVSESHSIVLLPQLHGPRHRDFPYLSEIAERCNARGGRVVVAAETLSSDEQRSIVAASRYVLAGRYHPLIFAVSAGVPAITIPYEHKASGFAALAGLSSFVVEIDDLESGRLIKQVAEMEARESELRVMLETRRKNLAKAANSTADSVSELLKRMKGSDIPCTF